MVQTVKISSEVLTQEVGGETVILDLKSEGYFGLDEIGTRMWQLIQEQKNLQSVTETMLNEYDVDPDQLKTDIKNLLNELVKSGLVDIED